MKYNLITSVKKETQRIENLIENCTAAPVKTELLFEAADKFLGRAIGAIKAGKNPFADNPDFRDTIAGLMLLAKDTNREALNINQKKFDLVSQYTSEKQDVQKYVAKHARNSGPSLIKELDRHIADKNLRQKLVQKLIQSQNEWSQAKHQVNRGKEVRQSLAV